MKIVFLLRGIIKELYEAVNESERYSCNVFLWLTYRCLCAMRPEVHENQVSLKQSPNMRPTEKEKPTFYLLGNAIFET